MKPRKPILLYLILTERCNYHCSFCIRHNIGNNLNEFDFDSLGYVTDILAKEYPNSVLLLTGGEPTIHPRFTDIVNIVLPKFQAVQITSNGSFGQTVREFIRPLLRQNLFLQISLDGTEEVHDNIRGRHAYKTAMANLKELKDVNSHVSISATVLPKNYENVKELAIELNSYAFSHFKVSSVIDEDATTINEKASSDWNSFVDSLLPLCNYMVNIRKMYDFELMKDFLDSGKINNVVTNCGIGYSKLYIRPNLDLLTCSCTSNVVGNLKNDTLEQIRQRLNEIIEVQSNLDENSVCYTCEFKPICNGGCPGYSQKIFGKPNFGDIRCPKVYAYAKSENVI